MEQGGEGRREGFRRELEGRRGRRRGQAVEARGSEAAAAGAGGLSACSEPIAKPLEKEQALTPVWMYEDVNGAWI